VCILLCCVACEPPPRCIEIELEVNVLVFSIGAGLVSNYKIQINCKLFVKSKSAGLEQRLD
jgi:hypothetical protein